VSASKSPPLIGTSLGVGGYVLTGTKKAGRKKVWTGGEIGAACIKFCSRKKRLPSIPLDLAIQEPRDLLSPTLKSPLRNLIRSLDNSDTTPVERALRAMLISSVELLPAAGQSAEDKKATIAFLEHISILGTVLLQFPGKTNAKQVEDLNYLLSVIRSVPAMIDNLPLMEDIVVTQLLDEGLRVAFFALDEETALFKDMLRTFPKERIGLTITDLAVALDAIQEYEQIVGHFIIKYVERRT
jgi:hypothetical protein